MPTRAKQSAVAVTFPLTTPAQVLMVKNTLGARAILVILSGGDNANTLLALEARPSADGLGAHETGAVLTMVGTLTEAINPTRADPRIFYFHAALGIPIPYPNVSIRAAMSTGPTVANIEAHVLRDGGWENLDVTALDVA